MRGASKFSNSAFDVDKVTELKFNINNRFNNDINHDNGYEEEDNDDDLDNNDDDFDNNNDDTTDHDEYVSRHSNVTPSTIPKLNTEERCEGSDSFSDNDSLVTSSKLIIQSLNDDAIVNHGEKI